MENYKSILILQKLVFDKIDFERKKKKNENKVDFKLQVQIGVGEDDTHKVTLKLTGEKRDEYNLLISLSGFFKIEKQESENEEIIQHLINKNAVAIMMPYLRSELTLLTAQPDTDSIVLPAFNVNAMMEK